MSTLPFLLSVADELDNIHTQSYLDDFGLGFHPHRQYYRTPTIQLSLPASTDWTGRTDWQGRHARFRSYKFYDDSQNNLEEEQDQEQEAEQQQQQQQSLQHELQLEHREHNKDHHQQQQTHPQQQQQQQQAHTANMVKSNSHDVGVGGLGLNLKAGEEEDDENIDRTVRMYNLSKKCCKNYYRHALEMDGLGASGRSKCSNARAECYHSGSSSEESLQKVPSPIEFLTCFLVKKTRAPKCSSHAPAAGRAAVGQLKKT
ncbi:putative uncharacterized protein DDB_G0274435 [Drosophila novamexicana]|uniref:putative uncharacterized protein DDB_G0274435 n=1 Tax=Drosophila novamexicana TaxID=47314 RepID=UPI0011E5A4EE|nr:putative uncharacterized protein DDB_G0274435 [Drosophila novamexicana]